MNSSEKRIGTSLCAICLACALGYVGSKVLHGTDAVSEPSVSLTDAPRSASASREATAAPAASGAARMRSFYRTDQDGSTEGHAPADQYVLNLSEEQFERVKAPLAALDQSAQAARGAHDERLLEQVERERIRVIDAVMGLDTEPVDKQ